MSRPYPAQIDCVWLAVDFCETTAVFITAGEGPIPQCVLDQDDFDVLDIEESVLQLPESTTGKVLIDVPRPEGYSELATRGFFVFDWTDIHLSSSECRNAYELVATPTIAIQMEKLPRSLTSIARLVRFKGVEFASSNFLSIPNEMRAAWPSVR
jgi:hypothetical protein